MQTLCSISLSCSVCKHVLGPRAQRVYEHWITESLQKRWCMQTNAWGCNAAAKSMAVTFKGRAWSGVSGPKFKCGCRSHFAPLSIPLPVSFNIDSLIRGDTICFVTTVQRLWNALNPEFAIIAMPWARPWTDQLHGGCILARCPRVYSTTGMRQHARTTSARTTYSKMRLCKLCWCSNTAQAKTGSGWLYHGLSSMFDQQ